VFRKAQTFFEWLGGNSVLVMAAVLAVVIGTWGFIELLDEVQEGDTEHFDTWVIRYLGQFRGENHPGWEEVGAILRRSAASQCSRSLPFWSPASCS
jgi:hypothetical protein